MDLAMGIPFSAPAWAGKAAARTALTAGAALPISAKVMKNVAKPKRIIDSLIDLDRKVAKRLKRGVKKHGEEDYILGQGDTGAGLELSVQNLPEYLYVNWLKATPKMRKEAYKTIKDLSAISHAYDKPILAHAVNPQITRAARKYGGKVDHAGNIFIPSNARIGVKPPKVARPGKIKGYDKLRKRVRELDPDMVADIREYVQRNKIIKDPY